MFVAVAPAEYLDRYARYGTQCTWSGHEYVCAGRIDGWHESPDGAPDARVLDVAHTLLQRYDAVL